MLMCVTSFSSFPSVALDWHRSHSSASLTVPMWQKIIRFALMCEQQALPSVALDWQRSHSSVITHNSALHSCSSNKVFPQSLSTGNRSHSSGITHNSALHSCSSNKVFPQSLSTGNARTRAASLTILPCTHARVTRFSLSRSRLASLALEWYHTLKTPRPLVWGICHKQNEKERNTVLPRAQVQELQEVPGFGLHCQH